MKILEYTLGLPPFRRGGLPRYSTDLSEELAKENRVYLMYPGQINPYSKKIKLTKLLILFSQIALFIFIILIWQILADKELINTFITSSPRDIIKTLITLYQDNNLFIHIWITIKETLISFTITTVLSILIAITLYNYKLLSKIIDPYLTILNSLPKVALGPIIIIWIGANIKGIITMSVLISIIVSIQSIYNGFINTDKVKIKLLKTFNATKSQILFNVILPSNKSTIISTLKINISMCLVGVIMGEFLTSKAGIGYLILYGSQVFNLNLVMTGIFLLIIISIIMYKLICIISKKEF